MSFNALCLIVSAVYSGSALALILLAILGKQVPNGLFDLSAASLAVLGSLLVNPRK